MENTEQPKRRRIHIKERVPMPNVAKLREKFGTNVVAGWLGIPGSTLSEAFTRYDGTGSAAWEAAAIERVGMLDAMANPGKVRRGRKPEAPQERPQAPQEAAGTIMCIITMPDTERNVRLLQAFMEGIGGTIEL